MASSLPPLSMLHKVSPSGERELDLGVVHLGDQRSATLASCDSLTPDDLDGVGSCSMSEIENHMI